MYHAMKQVGPVGLHLLIDANNKAHRDLNPGGLNLRVGLREIEPLTSTPGSIPQSIPDRQLLRSHMSMIRRHKNRPSAYVSRYLLQKPPWKPPRHRDDHPSIALTWADILTIFPGYGFEADS